MKNLLMIAIALITVSATAQEQKREARKGEMKQRMEMRQDMTPQEMAELQTKKMTLHLDLNDKQQAEVQKLLLDEATARKAKMAEYKAKKESASDEKLSKEDRLKMQNERLDHQIAMKRKMKAILSAEQYEKFEAMQAKRDGNKRRMYHKKSERK